MLGWRSDYDPRFLGNIDSAYCIFLVWLLPGLWWYYPALKIGFESEQARMRRNLAFGGHVHITGLILTI